MKFLGIMGKVIVAIWKFATTIFTICIVGLIVVFALSIIMPDNITKAIESIKLIVYLPTKW
jgi:predicted MFS family arabinose efflux permease